MAQPCMHGKQNLSLASCRTVITMYVFVMDDECEMCKAKQTEAMQAGSLCLCRDDVCIKLCTTAACRMFGHLQQQHQCPPWHLPYSQCIYLWLQDHYKGYKHQRMVARQAAAARSTGYNGYTGAQAHSGAYAHSGAARRMPFTPQRQPRLADLGYGSPSRSLYQSPYPQPPPADRWQTG